MIIAQFEKDWTPEQRYNVLMELDRIVRACADTAAISLIWDKYGGGRMATEEATYAHWRETANDPEKFGDALYAFAASMLYDHSWVSKFD